MPLAAGSRWKRPGRRAALGVVLIAASLASACGRGPERLDAADEPLPPFQNVTDAVAFTGDAACASCHEEVYASYQSHGMAQSLYPLTAETRIEPLPEAPIAHPGMGLHYTVVETDSGLFQEEFLPGPDGGRTHALRQRMDYVVGSGSAARTYLTERGGRLFELPLTWYTQEARWDFSPGYEARNGRFDRLIPDRCMACHNGYSEPIPHVEGAFVSLPHGIGCERCHGPGALHADARLTDPEAPDAIDYTIVNPAHLPVGRRLDVCQQCHLHTTVSVLREGRTAFGFRPGEALSDHVAFFSAPEPEGDGIDVISHADRMRQSACFVETQMTAAPLECTTCHDPHEGFRDAGPDYFNATCASCHAPDALAAAVAPEAQPLHAAGADCAGCHMPKVEAADAPHASFTDHHIRVVDGASEGAQPAVAPARAHAPLEAYYARDEGSREAQRYLGMALIVHGRQTGDVERMAMGAATLERALTAEDADTTAGEAAFLLGVAYHGLGDPARGLPFLERAVRLDPSEPQRLHALARAYAALGRAPDAAERLFERALGIQPALATVRADYGRFLQASGRTAEAVVAYREALAEQPGLADVALQLGTALAELERPSDAGAIFAEALRLNPLLADALRNTVRVRPGAAEEQAPAVRPYALAIAEGLPSQQALRVAAEGSGVRFEGVPAAARLRIYTSDGGLVRELPPKAQPTWDLRDHAGRLVPGGLYLVHARADDAGAQVGRMVVVHQPEAGTEVADAR